MKIKDYLSLVVRTRSFLTLLFVLAMSGCSVQLVSHYDEKTDALVTQLQKEIATFFVTVEGQEGLPECQYDNHQTFYLNSKVAISALQVRAKAIPNNAITITQIGLLNDSLGQLEQLHQLGCFTANTVTSVRTSFNSSITAILKLELAKKRGE